MPAIYLGGDDRFLVLVDEDDYVYFSQWRWHMAWVKGFYARRTPRVRGDNGRLIVRSVYLHLEIARRGIRIPRVVDDVGDPVKLVVDHSNRITLDNRRANLRWATHQENANNVPTTPRWQHWRNRKPIVLGQNHDTAELITESPYEDE